MGHEVRVLTADRVNRLPKRERRDGADVIRSRSLSPGRNVHFAPNIALSVARTDPQPDVVHAHNYHSLPLAFAALGNAALDVGFVCTPHYHGESQSPIMSQLLALYQPIGRQVLRSADAVIAVSEWEQDRLDVDLGITSTVIPNGVSDERFRGVIPESRDRAYLLCVSRLEEYKGIHHVVRALPEVPNYDLLIVGVGPYQNKIEAVARETGVRNRIKFLCHVDDARLPRLYAGAEAFLTLSEFEAYGLTVGEALAAGTPCVVRTAAALQDWTNIEGVVGIESVEPKEVADAIRKITKAEVNSDLPTWTDVSEQILKVYEQVSPPAITEARTE